MIKFTKKGVNINNSKQYFKYSTFVQAEAETKEILGETKKA